MQNSKLFASQQRKRGEKVVIKQISNSLITDIDSLSDNDLTDVILDNEIMQR